MSALDLLDAQIKLADIHFNNFEENEVSEEIFQNEYRKVRKFSQARSEFGQVGEDTIHSALRWVKRYPSWGKDWYDAYGAWLETEAWLKSGDGANKRAILYATFKVCYLMDYLRKR